MNENKKNKREWIKSAAIIFLSVMLVLTFFSNTIMNYSLPQVATQRIQSGMITAKVRGTGLVESGEPYNVEVKQARKVASVVAKVGFQVEKGDVLFYLEDEESEELNAAVKELDILQKAFDEAIITGAIDKNIANNVQSGNTSSVAEYQSRILAAKAEMDKAVKDAEDAQKWVDALNAQIAMTIPEVVNTAAEEKALNDAKVALDNAKLLEENAKTDFDKAKANRERVEIEEELAVSAGDAAAIEKVQAAKNAEAAEKTKLDARTVDRQNCEKVVNDRQIALNNAKKKAENSASDSAASVNNLKKQLPVAEYNRDVLSKKAEEKKSAYETLMSKITTELGLATKMDAIREKRELVEKLRAESIDSTIVSDIAGTVTQVNVVAGGTTTPGNPVAVLQPAGKGFTLSFSITNEQAKKISVGDPAELVNSWWYSDITAQVAAIRPDTTDPSKKKLVIFDLTGELTAGQSLSLAVGQKSANYDMIVPNSAIREDNNGKFILIIEYKSSPLGTRYMASRVDVEILASDDTQSAISGGVYGYEDVITTSTKPIEPGQQVRLPD